MQVSFVNEEPLQHLELTDFEIGGGEYTQHNNLIMVKKHQYISLKCLSFRQQEI
jgi:hypothetical protein